MTPILLCHNTAKGTVTFSLDGVGYVYTFPLNDHIRKTLVIYKASPLAALNYAKRWAMKMKRLEEVCQS